MISVPLLIPASVIARKSVTYHNTSTAAAVPTLAAIATPARENGAPSSMVAPLTKCESSGPILLLFFAGAGAARVPARSPSFGFDAVAVIDGLVPPDEPPPPVCQWDQQREHVLGDGLPPVPPELVSEGAASTASVRASATPTAAQRTMRMFAAKPEFPPPGGVGQHRNSTRMWRPGLGTRLQCQAPGGADGDARRR